MTHLAMTRCPESPVESAIGYGGEWPSPLAVADRPPSKLRPSEFEVWMNPRDQSAIKKPISEKTHFRLRPTRVRPQKVVYMMRRGRGYHREAIVAVRPKAMTPRR